MRRAPLSSDVADTRAMLETAAAVHGDVEAYVEPGARITFAEWIGRARSVAAQFADLGVGKGDVVTLWMPSGIDWNPCLVRNSALSPRGAGPDAFSPVSFPVLASQ